MTGIVNIGTVGESYLQSVRNYTSPEEKTSIVFTFAQFKLKPIVLSGEFNNHYKDIDHFSEKMMILLDKALPLLSKEKASLFTKDYEKSDALHLHRVSNKRDIVERVLKEYGFTEIAIDNMFEGQELYQLEVPYANGSTRIVFQRIDNLISLLFVDPNHHIYFNPKKVKEAGSIYYEHCPVNEKKCCSRMDYLGTCYAFEFLDEMKYNETYGYGFPNSE